MPGIIGSTGWDRSRAWTWDFSSAHSTTACSGGFRCGLRWKAFQIRPMVDRDKPERSAMDALDQWVASSGVSSSVSTTTFSTCSSVIVGHTSRTRLISEPVQAHVSKPLAPLPGRYLVTPEQRCGFLVVVAVRAGQDDIGPQRQGL